MNTITIDKKKYVLIPEKDYEELIVKAAKKSSPAKKLSLSTGKKLAYKMIDKGQKKSNWRDFPYAMRL